MLRRVLTNVTAAVWMIVLLPAMASAQSAITGLVRDSSGGVLPGVAVEASSPALIEKVRAVVTDAQGRYAIVDLLPGLYKVTFTIQGFSTFVQDSIELPSNFTATVNADLRVGAVEESVTVSGASPVVDVQNAQRTTVLTRQLLDAVPVPRMYQAEGALAVGTKVSDQNVGGARSAVNPRLTAHMLDARAVHQPRRHRAEQRDRTEQQLELRSRPGPAYRRQHRAALRHRAQPLPRPGAEARRVGDGRLVPP